MKAAPTLAIKFTLEVSAFRCWMPLRRVTSRTRNATTTEIFVWRYRLETTLSALEVNAGKLRCVRVPGFQAVFLYTHPRQCDEHIVESIAQFLDRYFTDRDLELAQMRLTA